MSGLKGTVGGLNVGDPWENLANAIVAQAAHDYELTFSPRNKSVDRDEVMRFFHSGWYKLLTSVDSQYLIQGLDQKVKIEK